MAALKVDTAGTPQRPRSVRTVRTFASADDDVSNGSEWARTVKDPWDPAILTLDGGGIRGYSSLLMVQQLMHEIAEWERKLEMEEAAEAATRRKDGTSTPPFEPREFNEDELLPAHYFDFMYGTSTGGLIATMLGRLRMSVPQCLELYRQVGNDLFGTRRSVVPLTTKYRHKPLEEAVKEIVKRHCKTHPNGTCDGNDWFPWDVEEEEDQINSLVLRPGEQICHSICLTATHNERVNEAHLLRTYNHRYVNIPNYITLYNEGADKLRIWEVTRATSAAPFYFKILEADIRGEMMGFKDGGIRENNPAGAAWSEFVSLYGEHRDPALLLSLGTGRPDESADGFASAWPGPFGNSRAMKKVAEKFAVFKNVLIKYTEGEEQHRAMVRIAKGENTWYKRLNVDKGLEKMKLDNWEKGAWGGPGAFAAAAATATAVATAPATKTTTAIASSSAPAILASSTAAALRDQRVPRADTGTDRRRLNFEIPITIKSSVDGVDDVIDEDPMSSGTLPSTSYDSLSNSNNTAAATASNSQQDQQNSSQKDKDAAPSANKNNKTKNTKKPKKQQQPKPKPKPKPVPGGRTLTAMEDATAAYLHRPFDHKYDTYAPPMVKVRQAAEKLVRQRRARERAAHEDPMRWDTYMGRWLTGSYADEADGVVRWKDGGGGGEGGIGGRMSLRSLRSVGGKGEGARRGSGEEEGEGEGERQGGGDAAAAAQASGERLVGDQGSGKGR
ncbi:patatin phospholipase a2-related protein [Diplodia corticola]|uniref:Patatin phospholipase a2-related protein n=1 Tax=Diplodia corticola TaxID=236234 RepID=A0A1J9RDA2_9PEZI|nr:patatin phospholipase a2-related protein [Diplodia corticola]OJD30515.1 patatin phospholipase a2-related protein [Diplodia corticola]